MLFPPALDGAFALATSIVYDLALIKLSRNAHAMDVFEAVDSRISYRWFLDRPVAPALVRNLIAGAARAASGGNLQPWQIYALTGAALARLKRQGAAAIARGGPRPAAAEYS